MTKISKNVIRRIGKDIGVDRISAESVDILQQQISEYTVKLLSDCKDFAVHDKRVTVQKEDVMLLLSKL